MRILLEAALSNAVVASLLALVVVAICRFPIRPAARHALWLIVLVKFVTPPFFRLEIPNSLCLGAWTSEQATEVRDECVRDIDQNSAVTTVDPSSQELGSPANSLAMLDLDVLSAGSDDELITEGQQASFPDSATASPLETAKVPVSAATTPAAGDDVPEKPASSLTGLSEKSVKPSKSALNVSAILGTIWIGGSVAWFMFAGVRLRAFHRQVVRLLPANEELQRLADEVAFELGLKKSPLLRITDAVVPPMLTLVPNQAVIILPARLMSTLSRSQQSAILAHELAHFRRGDQWMRWFEFVVVGLYWWHPAVWYARKQLQAAEELCCDAWVLRVYPDQARGYAHALLAAVDFLAEVRAPAPAEACTLGPISSLKQRLDMILKRKAFPELTPAAKLALAALAFIILPWAPELFGQAPAAAPPAETPPLTAPAALPPPSAVPSAQSLPEAPLPPTAPPLPNVPTQPRAGGPAPEGQGLPTADPVPRNPVAGNTFVTPPAVAPAPTVPPVPPVSRRPVAATFYPRPDPDPAPAGAPQGKSIEERLDRLERMIEQFLTRAPSASRYTSSQPVVESPVGTSGPPSLLPARKRGLWTDESLAATDRRIRELEQELESLKRRKEALSKVDSNGLAIGVVPQEKAIRALNMATGAIQWTFSIDNPESVQSATSDGQVVTVTTKDGNTFRLDSKTGRLILGALPASPASAGPFPKGPPSPDPEGLQRK